MMTSQELLQMQTDAASFGDTTCVIQRGTRAPNTQGGASTSPSTVATVKVTMAQPSADTLTNYAYLIGSLASWTVKMPFGTSVLEEDTLLINGEILTVKKVLAPESYEIQRSVIACEVK